ncbi:MAG TPA: asparagine synthase-related protein [Pseudonocardiaceae bacterium]|nr:asparagine synthase-related protein [Pseudonocardiaceae bacterium]
MDVLIEGWVVLPDRPDARRVAVEWPSQSRWALVHPSGNLWLVGSLDQEVTLASVGSLRVAVIGSCPVTATRLTDLVRSVRTVAELDSVAQALPGSFHLVTSMDGVVRVQGNATGLRRVFTTRIQGIPIAGDRADVLARMAGAGVDEQVLAVRVACWSRMPLPLAQRCLWRGVRALAPDHYLRIDSSGTVSELRWWQPPEPDLALTTGASAVRQALETAIAARRPSRGRLSTDLSGGLDSTSLCFLAAQAGPPDLLTFRCTEADDDAAFAASGLRHAKHVVLGPADMPGIFAGIADIGDTEAPYPFIRSLARVRHSARLLAAHGAEMHLAPHGGDELFHTPTAHLRSLLGRRPVTAITQMPGYQALRHWPSGGTGYGLTRSGPPPWIPAWVTPAAVDIAQTMLHSTGDQAHPPIASCGYPLTLAILRMMGTHYRQLPRVFATDGLRLELPYFDDRVVEAVLAIRQDERRTPWRHKPLRHKPLLIEAMRPILPEVVVAGSPTGGCHRGGCRDNLRGGLGRHLPRILNLFADSALAAHGLINPDLLRDALLTPQVGNAAVSALEDLLGCETWLRATQTASRRRNSAAAALTRS